MKMASNNFKVFKFFIKNILLDVILRLKMIYKNLQVFNHISK